MIPRNIARDWRNNERVLDIAEPPAREGQRPRSNSLAFSVTLCGVSKKANSCRESKPMKEYVASLFVRAHPNFLR
jgi:hypothetical protein